MRISDWSSDVCSSDLIPGSVFICTIDGHYPEDIDDIWDKDPDKILIADPDTICVAPGFTSPTAFVIADAFNRDGTEVDIAPRTILKKVLGLYADKGWKPIRSEEHTSELQSLMRNSYA